MKFMPIIETKFGIYYILTILKLEAIFRDDWKLT